MNPNKMPTEDFMRNMKFQEDMFAKTVEVAQLLGVTSWESAKDRYLRPERNPD